MSYWLIFSIFVLWLLPPAQGTAPGFTPAMSVGILFLGYVLIILPPAIRARMVLKRANRWRLLGGDVDNFHFRKPLPRPFILRLFARTARFFIRCGRNFSRYDRLIYISRILVPVWLAFCIYGPVGWKHIVHSWVSPTVSTRHAGQEFYFHLPAFLVGVFPAIFAWVGLWWASFPAECAIREHEQQMLREIDPDIPVHPPVSFYSFFQVQFRQQILFLMVPIAMALALHDLFVLVLHQINLAPLLGPLSIGTQDLDEILMIPSAGLVYVFAPVFISKILGTRSLPQGPLRDRLEAVCTRAKLRYRDILLWKTDFSMGNAAVMGLIPQIRYILLSDLLLERMNDRQIEAVFAHEIGHVVYRHLAWYVMFFLMVVLASMGPGASLADVTLRHLQEYLHLSNEQSVGLRDIGVAVVQLVLMFFLFGFLSRRFERQADVFAARMIETNWCSNPSLSGAPNAGADKFPTLAPAGRLPVTASFVGEYGAGVVAGALQRVAQINNMPTRGFTWRHDNIATRMRYLHTMSADPQLTTHFDRFMKRLKITLIAAIIAFGAWSVAYTMFGA